MRGPFSGSAAELGLLDARQTKPATKADRSHFKFSAGPHFIAAKMRWRTEDVRA
jgi:hypothetical protein